MQIFKYNFIILILLLFLFFLFFYLNTWSIFIGNSDFIFSDLKLNVHWLKCNYLNFKVYEDNTCNLFKTNYGPSFFLIPFNEILEKFYLNYLPVIIILIFLIASVIINNPKSLLQSVIVFFSIFNPAVFLLIERMNFDIYIFLLLIFIVYNKFYFLNWITIIFLGLTKIYPFIFGITIFLENLNRSKIKLLIIFLFISITTSFFFFLEYDKYLYVLTSSGAKAGLHLLFSIKSFSKILKYLFDINYIFSLPLLIFCFITIIRKITINYHEDNILEFVSLESSKAKLFLISGLTIFLCYIFFSNYLYREVFFILLIPYLYELLEKKDFFYIKILLYLFLIKFIFNFVYGYFNVFDSFYYLKDVRFYSSSFLFISIIKSLLDFTTLAFIGSLIFILLNEYFEKLKSQIKILNN